MGGAWLLFQMNLQSGGNITLVSASDAGTGVDSSSAAILHWIPVVLEELEPVAAVVPDP